MADFSTRLKELRIKYNLSQDALAKKLNEQSNIQFYPSKIGMYERGERRPSYEVLNVIADFFNVDMDYLTGRSDYPSEFSVFDNISPITTRRFPVLGEIACGEPRYTGDAFESYIDAGSDINADFCLKCRGDSMVDARIYDGDIVFIRQQDDVESGEIAAVIIGDEATLKRVNKQVPGFLLLEPANQKYDPIVINLNKLNDDSEPVRIIGKAIAFQSNLV